MGDVSRLAANSLDQLGTELSRLRPEQSGYITAEDYERLTGEELDELSTKGRKMIMNLATRHKNSFQDATDRNVVARRRVIQRFACWKADRWMTTFRPCVGESFRAAVRFFMPL